MSVWYFVRDGRREGPVSMEFIADEVRRGRLGHQDLVWGEGMDDWAAVADLPEVLALAASTPPPLPSEIAAEEASARKAEADAQQAAAWPGVGEGPPQPEPNTGASGYASFGMRLAAHVIDQLVLLLPGVLVAYGTYLFLAENRETFDLQVKDDFTEWTNLMQVAFLPFQLVYYAAMESSPWQATVGKRVLGLMVQHQDGARITLARALVRILVKSFTLFFGALLVLLLPKRQALHDLIASTVIVYGRSDA